ncbi:fyve, rhogef and ph domain-containing protein 4 [Plakobranchus ocellatus]|uniref:Fyve, rhogef and ph domain-containing protein 4 n=1 Tax=Plakobranchus ocellatus TaxID=259542 RepID=A0AAV4BVZ4_9GAST|nr:fyve, rhogef and ph domain-containing protein 4 [Plakobranchus ocellatus]
MCNFVYSSNQPLISKLSVFQEVEKDNNSEERKSHLSYSSPSSARSGKPHLCDTLLPRSKSQPKKALQPVFSPCLTSPQTQHGSVQSNNIPQASELFKVYRHITSKYENENHQPKYINSFCESSPNLDGHLFQNINKNNFETDNRFTSDNRLDSQILKLNQEADDKAVSCVECRELRCPKTCTNWKAHCLQRAGKISALPLTNGGTGKPFSSSLSLLSFSALNQQFSEKSSNEHFINHTSNFSLEEDKGNSFSQSSEPLVKALGQHCSNISFVKLVQNKADGLEDLKPGKQHTSASASSFAWNKLYSPNTSAKALSDQDNRQTERKKLKHNPISSLPSFHILSSFPVSVTNTNLCESDQPFREAGSFWSAKPPSPSLHSNMAKGYVKALAEQINHLGPPAGSNGSEEEEGDSSVSVHDMVRKINRSKSDAAFPSSPSVGKNTTSKNAHNSGALQPGAFKGDSKSPQYQSGSGVSTDVPSKSSLFESLKKAADKKRQVSNAVGANNISTEHEPSKLHSLKTDAGRENFSSQSFAQNSSMQTHPNNNPSNGSENGESSYPLPSKISLKHRKYSEPPFWSPSAKSETESFNSNPGSQMPVSLSKAKPPVDYSRKPSLDHKKIPSGLSTKRPSLPSHAIISDFVQSNQSINEKEKVSPSSTASSTSSSSSPLSPPSLVVSCHPSHASNENNEPERDETDFACRLNTKDTRDNSVSNCQESKETALHGESVASVKKGTENSAAPALTSVCPESMTLQPPSSPAGSESPALRLSRGRAISEYRESVLKTIYDNGPPLNAAELFDSSWSDSDSFNDFADENDEEDEETGNDALDAHGKDGGTGGEDGMGTDTPVASPVKTEAERKADSENKRRLIVQEMLKTEKDYVARLHLLHHVFYFRLDKANRQQEFVPPDILNHMFSNIKSIYLFHHDFLLQQMEEKVTNWDQDPRIGDLLKRNAPFLKMYSEYIANFDNAMKLIDQWTKKSSKFSNIIKTIQELPECGSLSLQHHMLEPIQRVPRYEMLIKDYVKHLPVDSPDIKDAQDALDLVTKAAIHSNQAMKKIERFQKLLDVYQTLKGVPLDFISPTREFVTQGPVTKIAARSGEKLPRQLFLFNDLILVCTQYNTLLGTFNVRSQLEMDSIEIKPGNNMHIAKTFRVHSKQKAVELLDEDQNGGSFGWEQKIQDQLALYKKRKRSIKHEDNGDYIYEPSMPDSWVGKTAPVWIPDDAATMCMLCQMAFNMLRRRHHCRACGKLICRSCSPKNAPLQYNKGKIERVCTVCYDIIVNKQTAGWADFADKKKGLLQIKASEPALMSSYVQCSEDNGNSWHRMWITAHKDFVLYCFKAHEDVSAISCLPLPGHEVKQVWDVEGRPHVFSLVHKHKVVSLYQAQDDKQLKNWISVVGKLVQAEIPDETVRLSTCSYISNASISSDGDSGSSGFANTGSGGNQHSGSSNNDIPAAVTTTSTSASNTTITSNDSGTSQADSGLPGEDGDIYMNWTRHDNHDPDQDCLSVEAPGVSDDHEEADKVSQYDNVDAVAVDGSSC